VRWEWVRAIWDDSGIRDRPAFTKALDELQAAPIVCPSQVVYQPAFTWAFDARGRTVREATRRIGRDPALKKSRGVSDRRRHDRAGRTRARD
jgi:hypothetical protein